LHAIKPAAQFAELFRRLDLAALAQPFSLCLHCNLPLRPVPKAEVLERLPESVRVQHDEFNTCDSCGRVFWKGSHYKRMAGMLDAVQDAVRQTMTAPAAVESTAPSHLGPRPLNPP
jgi:uncharacterized protein with PIN domain